MKTIDSLGISHSKSTSRVELRNQDRYGWISSNECEIPSSVMAIDC